MKRVDFRLRALDKNGTDYIEPLEKNKDKIGSVWIESDLLSFEQANFELNQITENKIIRESI
jgi:hypothetical protein